MAQPTRIRQAKRHISNAKGLLISLSQAFDSSDQILSAELRRISEDLAGATTHIDRAWSDHKAVNL